MTEVRKTRTEAAGGRSQNKTGRRVASLTEVMNRGPNNDGGSIQEQSCWRPKSGTEVRRTTRYKKTKDEVDGKWRDEQSHKMKSVGRQ